MKHEWEDFKASAATEKTPGARWTYYCCKVCGEVSEEKTDGECSGKKRFDLSNLNATPQLIHEERERVADWILEQAKFLDPKKVSPLSGVLEIYANSIRTGSYRKPPPQTESPPVKNPIIEGFE